MRASAIANNDGATTVQRILQTTHSNAEYSLLATHTAARGVYQTHTRWLFVHMKVRADSPVCPPQSGVIKIIALAGKLNEIKYCAGEYISKANSFFFGMKGIHFQSF